MEITTPISVHIIDKSGIIVLQYIIDATQPILMSKEFYQFLEDNGYTLKVREAC